MVLLLEWKIAFGCRFWLRPYNNWGKILAEADVLRCGSPGNSAAENYLNYLRNNIIIPGLSRSY
jgi:hypothetical protein